MEDEIKPRPKSSGRRVMEALLMFSVFCILLSILFPPHHHSRENARRSSCQSNLKQIMLAVKQYSQDYDEKFPILTASQAEFGWAGALSLRSTAIFQCPSEEIAAQSDPSQFGYTDYWFNARVAGVAEKQIKDQSRTITLGDGDSSNARYHLLSIPARWREDEKSPLYRHLDGANHAFADGHVKWFKAIKWKDGLDFSSKGEATLRLKPVN